MLDYKMSIHNKSPKTSKSSSEVENIEIQDYFGLKVISEIGQGGYGRVVKASNVDGKEYAVKIFTLELEYSDDLGYLREIYYGNLFDHPNINKPVFCRMNSSHAYIVMELADMDLEVYIQRDVPASEKIRIGYSIATAIDYIHRGGFVDCDIKSTNVLMFGDQPRLTDLGLTRVGNVGRSDGDCQTYIYRSPENVLESLESLKSNVKNLEWNEFETIGECWSTGVLMLDIIYGQYGSMAPGEVEYTDILSEVLAHTEKGLSMPNAVQKVLGKINPKDEPFLETTCQYLLNFDPSKRGLSSFLNDPLFEVFQRNTIEFRYQQVDEMYHPNDEVSVSTLQIILDKMRSVWIELGDLSLCDTSNSIDFIIQHAHKMPKNDKIMYAVAVSWIMGKIGDSIYPPSLDDYLDVLKRKKETKLLVNTVIEIANSGIRFESLYFYLKDDIVAQESLADIITNIEAYVAYKRPLFYAQKYNLEEKGDKIKRRNKSLKLKK